MNDLPLTTGGRGAAIALLEKCEKPGVLDNSRPLDVHKWSEHISVNRAVGAILAEIFTFGSPQLQALNPESPKRKQRLHDHLKIVVLDLVIAWSEAAEETDLRSVLGRPFVAYSRNKNSYSSGSRYAALHIKYPFILAVVDALCALGYVEHQTGFHDRRTGIGRQSRMRATMKLMELVLHYRISPKLILRRHPLIVLRDLDGADIDVSGMSTAQRLAPAVVRINEMLQAAAPRLELTREQRVDLLMRCHIDPTRTTVYRVFNRTFTQGGRFFGHWIQNIPREYRQFLTINGHPAVELDYDCYHSRMLYAAIGATPPPGDLYDVTGVDPTNRPVIKILLNSLINAQTEQAAINSLLFDKHGNKTALALKFGLRYGYLQRLVAGLKAKHHLIADKIGSGAGIRLQFIDSEISKDIMLNLWAQGIHSIPMHDSFIVGAPHAVVLGKSMRDVSAQHLKGIAIPADVKYGAAHLTEGDAIALRAL